MAVLAVFIHNRNAGRECECPGTAFCLTGSYKCPFHKPTAEKHLNYAFRIVEHFLIKRVLVPPGLPLTCILNQASTSSRSTFIDNCRCLSSEGVVLHRLSEDTCFLFSFWSADLLVTNVVFHFQVWTVVAWLMFSCLPFVFILQVCCDGLLLGLRSWRKTQVSAAGAMSNWISCSIRSLRLKLQKKIQFTDWEKAWHTSAAPCITQTHTHDVYKASTKGRKHFFQNTVP